jgi:putative sterol carrier protein
MAAPLFVAIGELLQKDPEVGKKAAAVFQFVIKRADGSTSNWVVDTKAGVVKEEKAAKADCTLTLSEDDFVAMVSGKLAAQKAFMMGKLKIGGNMGMAQKVRLRARVASASGARPRSAALAARGGRSPRRVARSRAMPATRDAADSSR